MQPTVETPEYDPVEDGSEEDTVWTDVHVDDSATVPEVDAPEGHEPIVDYEAENLFGDDVLLDLGSGREHYDAGDSEADASEDHESGHDYDHADDSDAEAAEDSQAEDDTMDLDEEEEEESGEHSESDTDAPEIVPTPTQPGVLLSADEIHPYHPLATRYTDTLTGYDGCILLARGSHPFGVLIFSVLLLLHRRFPTHIDAQNGLDYSRIRVTLRDSISRLT